MQVQCGRGKRIKGFMLPISEPGVCFYNTGRQQRSRTWTTVVPLGAGRKVDGTRHLPVSYAPQAIPVRWNRSFLTIWGHRGHKLACCTLSVPVCQGKSRPQLVPFICAWEKGDFWNDSGSQSASRWQYFGGVYFWLVGTALFTFHLAGFNLYYPHSTPFPRQACATNWFSDFIPISRMICGRYCKESKQKGSSMSEKLLYPMHSELPYLLLVAKNIFFFFQWNKSACVAVLDHGILQEHATRIANLNSHVCPLPCYFLDLLPYSPALTRISRETTW